MSKTLSEIHGSKFAELLKEEFLSKKTITLPEIEGFYDEDADEFCPGEVTKYNLEKTDVPVYVKLIRNRFAWYVAGMIDAVILILVLKAIAG